MALLVVSFLPDSILLESGDKLLLENSDTAALEQDQTVAYFEDAVEAALLHHEDLQDSIRDTINMQSMNLTLFANAHYGPSATGDFPDPGEFQLTEKIGDFEIRSPL